MKAKISEIAKIIQRKKAMLLKCEAGKKANCSDCVGCQFKYAKGKREWQYS